MLAEFRYEVTDHTLWRLGEDDEYYRITSDAYSGFAQARNDPTMERVAGVGPIPRGWYVIGEPHLSRRTGPCVMNLLPHAHVAWNRSAFQIHGDNRTGTASRGCIVLPITVRQMISKVVLTTLESVMLEVVE